MRRNLKSILKITATLCAVLLISTAARAAKVDTTTLFSKAMNKPLKQVVITPEGYDKAQHYPVLYLLHGFSGNYSDWILKVPAIKGLADQYHMIIVCPDGGFAAWYFDSPMSKEWQFETYVAKEVVSYVDSHYSTIAKREGRAITGLSMGGHGALYLAFRHQDIYGACGSMSGGVDIRQFPDAFGIEQVLGKYSENKERWENNAVVNMVYLLKPNSLSIIVDCGYDDFMFPSNVELHEKLLLMKIPHDFIIRPGNHTWEYWANSLDYQTVFFNKFFQKDLMKKK